MELCYLGPEFQRGTLDSLRQPIECGEAVAAMNPCRCGDLADAAQACERAPKWSVDFRAFLFLIRSLRLRERPNQLWTT